MESLQKSVDSLHSRLDVEDAKTILSTLKQCSDEVNKVWSDEAREASAEARRGAGGGGGSKYSPSAITGKVGDALDGTDYQPRESSGGAMGRFKDKDVSFKESTPEGEIHSVKVHDPRDETDKTIYVAVRHGDGGKPGEPLGGYEKASWAKDALAGK